MGAESVMQAPLKLFSRPFGECDWCTLS